MILSSFFFSVNVLAQQEEKKIFTEKEVKEQAILELQLLTENYAISNAKQEQVLSFLIHKIKFLSKPSLSTEQRNSIVKGRFTRRLVNILNQNNNGETILLDESLLRQLNLQVIESAKQ